jgi:hypothetical protein
MATTINSTGLSTDGITIVTSNPPETPTSNGNSGQIAWDENFIYICVAPNTWARTNISIFWG